MEIEIKIGREVEGSSVLMVPATCKRVSRRHATLHWKDGAASIEDNESANGTFVNGRRIAKTKLNENDSVWLGGTEGTADCYQVDLKKIFESCHKAEEKLRTDYSKEFQDLKQTYIDYQAAVAELKKKTTMKSQLPLRIVSFIPTLIGAIIAVWPSDNPAGNGSTRIIAISVGGAITGLINILMIGKGSGTNDKLNEEITELQINYQKRYCCPKCGMKYPFSTHWKKLEADGKCPNPKCDAKFVK